MKTFQIAGTLLLSSGLALAQQYSAATVAGVPQVSGYFGEGIAATTAQFYKPTRVVLDSKGNYYIADLYTNAVRMVTASTGKIATIAGSGTPGFAGDNDVATSAKITQVYGVAADGNGNVYFSDTGNSRIRKVDTKGNIFTIAGNGTPGYTGDGAAAGSAEVWFPAGMVLDGSGNLYFADYGSSTVRKIAASGLTISTVAGTGTWGNSGDGGAATKANLAAPMALAMDAAGNLYIGDVANSTIRKVGTDGNIKTVASNVAPQSLAVDAAGNLYFVDGLAPFVRKILPNGTILNIAGTGADGYNGDTGVATSLQLNHPSGVAVDASGNVLVADTNNEIIRKLTPVPFSVGAVLNAASSVQGPIAPGEIVAVFGAGIGPATTATFSVSNGTIANTLASDQIYFNGIAAPLLTVSSGFATAIVPYGIAGSSKVDVAVKYQGNVSNTTTFPAAAAAPGIFTANSTGSGPAAAVNADGTLNTATAPAKVGSTISLFITGDGQTAPGGSDGKLTTAPYSTTGQPVKVTIGGVAATVSYAGSVPGVVAGLTQVNVQIPVGVSGGAAVPVALTVGGTPAQSGVTVSVQ
jgi:uncharacterized protein (TIGR03437 family)